MKMTPAAERIAEACRGIVRRSDQIVALAETPDARLSRIFSRKEIAITNRICCELALAVADSESVDDLAANRENFEMMRERVIAFVRKVYRESDPKVRSWTKAVQYVRTSCDGQCAEIRKSVAGFAKPGADGLEKAWNSIRQQAKVLDERMSDAMRIRK